MKKYIILKKLTELGYLYENYVDETDAKTSLSSKLIFLQQAAEPRTKNTTLWLQLEEKQEKFV